MLIRVSFGVGFGRRVTAAFRVRFGLVWGLLWDPGEFRVQSHTMPICSQSYAFVRLSCPPSSFIPVLACLHTGGLACLLAGLLAEGLAWDSTQLLAEQFWFNSWCLSTKSRGTKSSTFRAS